MNKKMLFLEVDIVNRLFNGFFGMLKHPEQSKQSIFSGGKIVKALSAFASLVFVP